MKVNEVLTVDCLSGLKEIEDDSVDHVLTSPPYNRKRNDKYKFYNDDLVDYRQFLDEVISECLRVSQGYVFFNIQKNYYNKWDVFELIGKYSKNIIDIVIWNKSNPMPSPGTQVTNSYEFIIVLAKSKKSLRGNETYTKNTFTTNVFTNNEYNSIHKAVMHPDAARYIITNFTKPNDLILDPFMGVGTTGVVCAEEGRNVIGFEINETYSDIANKRLSAYL